MTGLRWVHGKGHVVIEAAVFAPGHPLGQVSALALKTYAFLIHKANHDDWIDGATGNTIVRGQWLTSLGRLATGLNVRDPRTVKGALVELVQVGAIEVAGLRQKVQKASADSAEGFSRKRSAKSAEVPRKSALINVCDFNDLAAPSAKSAEVSSSFRTTTKRTRGAVAPASISSDVRREDEQLRARARSRALRSGRSEAEELAALQAEAVH